MSEPSAFPATSWNLIKDCQDPAATSYRASLNTLFIKYWGPVYAYIRRSYARQDAEARDLTQAFFLTFLQKAFIDSVDADKGRFRAFVRVAVRNFVLNQKRAAKAIKRAPEQALLSLDQLKDKQFDVAASSADDPDAQFLNDWRKSVLRAALEALREQCAAAGQQDRVALLKAYDLAPDLSAQPTYEQLAKQFGLTVSQVRNRLRSVRKELMLQVRREIRDQVASEADYRQEALLLFGMEDP